MRAVVFTGADGREVRLEERPDPVPGRYEVVVEVSHAGLNPADLAQREGRYRAPEGSPEDIPGLEVAGVVTALGPGVTAWAGGDRVFGLVGGGGLANRVVAHEAHLTRVPDGLENAAAAAVPEAFITAHDALLTQAKLRDGETLVVTGANGGVGTAAVQIGRAAGARVFAGVRSDDVRARVAALGVEGVNAAELVERIRAAGGANVVLELVGAPNLAADLDMLAPKGRIMLVGITRDTEAILPLWKLMRTRATLIGTILRGRPPDEKAAAVSAFANDIIPLLVDGQVAPVIDRIFPADAAADALEHLAGPGKFGKVLLAF